MENELPKTGEVTVKEAGVAMEGVSTVPVSGAVASKKLWMDRVEACKGFLRKMDRTTKSFIIVFGVFAIILGIFTSFKGSFVAATVNGEAISRLAVVRELEKQAGKSVLETMITKKLIEDEIKKQKVVVTDADIDAEIKKMEAQIGAQGTTLEAALAGQGMTMDDLREQVRINKGLEQILADKITVSDEEISQYLSTAPTPAGQGVSSDEERNQVRERLKGQKFGQAASQWVGDLKAKATIDYSVQYE